MGAGIADMAALTGVAAIPVITAIPTGVGLIGVVAAAGVVGHRLPLLLDLLRRDHGPVLPLDLLRVHRLGLRPRAGLREYSLNKQIIPIRTGAVKRAPVSVLAY
ncbi:Hypothetical protein GbCGDNIH7_2357 [Granulibacter bethesdensis]|nr:Hypothetical protein GbCGDNIH7_2357 [Granulibacter bethesdensis]